jgi:hypothetical protein
MYNPRLILTIIIVFLIIVTLPFWYSRAMGGPGQAPRLELPVDEKKCVESKEYMRKNHVSLLVEWRDEVVREGKRTYTAQDGRQHEMSLTGTCLKCHSNKSNFCDRCHNYVKVSPKCYECHTFKERDAGISKQ